jgi:YebC/PmpR family DNA-binding regulatory protein
MSKHSHWAKIKRKKEISDKKRGQMFSKVLRMISVSAKNGGDPETNSALRLAIEKAKEFNLPKDTIERAIKKGAGEAAGQALEEVLYEAYGPGKIAILIESITDNKNRAFNEIKKILESHNGKLVAPGSVKWLFERKGCLIVNFKLQIGDLQNREKLEMVAIEAGAEDIRWSEDILDIYTKPEDLENVKRNLENKEIKIESASLDWVAKEEIKVSEENTTAAQKLFEDLDESEEVQEIYSNLKME